ncbi:ADP-ribosylation factor GTPase-activating protein AGD4-like isoform X1 [Phalaenopsis equestris]|uniref:ADP-ribosylation factor GTPase-activating protein AGD4-like isoform X1 n=2 Tax=Phalaenopsis equestris TaxID=78828 RepID=UPI0009E37B07|nr:ADP-ribosylation factor GTPase-activating protein AGD4-like isoform X1 [Phalaenopsis equestris]
MAAFAKLEDSPMFRKQIFSLEREADELKDRCQKLQKGCKRFMNSIGEAYDGDFSFAESLEAFGAGQDDPTSVAIGGPVMSNFTTAFREIGTYKELLRSQVEHMLSDRLMEVISVDMQNIKDCRRRFDKASSSYDQVRDKFMSLKKGSKKDVVTELEEDLHNSKSSFERCRLNLVNALASFDAKKKYEFLESISAVMDAHLRYFKQGYELLNQLEPFIHQVLAYAQQSKEMANAEQDKLERRIQEFRTQAELASLRALSHAETSTSGDGNLLAGSNSYKSIEALMLSAANGPVQTIKQGYLLKRSSGLRAEWNRRFFVLDSHGALYYYRHKNNKHLVGDNMGSRTFDLHTSTIKIDAEQTDLRFCFRIISPLNTYTFQAESEADRLDWVDKIKGVIASLLNSSLTKQLSMGSTDMHNSRFSGSCEVSLLAGGVNTKGFDNVSKILRCIPGNEACAECGAPEPDWASLNLGILMCIECSGIHRNFGVHISKVRSLTLDVKVWEPVIMDLFQALGNSYCNSVWEEALFLHDKRLDDLNGNSLFNRKPSARDAFSVKEKFIQSKYVEKIMISKEDNQPDLPPVNLRSWEAVKSSNIRAMYRLLVVCDANPNTVFDGIRAIGSTNIPEGCSLLHLACYIGNPVMVELLLQFGADINKKDFEGRTPLHCSIFRKNDLLAKYLIRRGANTLIKDGGGLTCLERAMELGAITDEELFILLAGHE